jgi:hypothetical protein
MNDGELQTLPLPNPSKAVPLGRPCCVWEARKRVRGLSSGLCSNREKKRRCYAAG